MDITKVNRCITLPHCMAEFSSLKILSIRVLSRLKLCFREIFSQFSKGFELRLRNGVVFPRPDSAPSLTHFGDDGLGRDLQEAVVGNGRPELSKAKFIQLSLWECSNYFQLQTWRPRR